MKRCTFQPVNKTAGPAWAFGIGLVLLLLSAGHSTYAQQNNGNSAKPHIRLALNAYSFNDVLTGNRQKDNKPTLTLPGLLDWCATQDIDGIDLTGYYFPGYPEAPSDQYIYDLKNQAFRLGIEITGTGIRNNFASPDPAVRADGVKRAKEWIVVAAKLGAPVLRLFAGEIPKGYENRWDEVAAWMVPCYKECAEFGAKHGVIIGIQNHGDMLQTAEQCIKVLEAVDSKWVGLILDTGSFRVEDPYRDIEKAIPYAVNWQVKDSVFAPDSGIPANIPKLVNIIKRSGYRGYIPIETLYVKGKSYDPYVLVPKFLSNIRAALDAE